MCLLQEKIICHFSYLYLFPLQNTTMDLFHIQHLQLQWIELIVSLTASKVISAKDGSPLFRQSIEGAEVMSVSTNISISEGRIRFSVQTKSESDYPQVFF